jgi:hypothetical protein
MNWTPSCEIRGEVVAVLGVDAVGRVFAGQRDRGPDRDEFLGSRGERQREHGGADCRAFGEFAYEAHFRVSSLDDSLFAAARLLFAGLSSM